MTENIKYGTSNISKYFSTHRISWDQFYPSEKHVIERVNPSSQTKVLDMGCACGGLGKALQEKFGIAHYFGVDINSQAILAAKTLLPWGEFSDGDFLDVGRNLPKDFGLAFSLSCADWNVGTEKLLTAVFDHVADGGNLIISCRVIDSSDEKLCLQGRQKIAYPNSDGATNAEFAPYKVFSIKRIIGLLKALPLAGDIYGYGYWGAVPDSVQNLSLKQVFFIVFSIKKETGVTAGRRTLVLDVPTEIQSAALNYKKSFELD